MYVSGNTALHDSAESGSLDIMKLLLQHGAVMDKDSYGMTPLMAAAVAGFKNIIDYLVSLPTCNRNDYVNALELLGATYVDKKRDSLAAIRVWRRALEERKRPGRPPLPKSVPDKPNPAYLNAAEVQDIEELEEMISDPDEMRMQALLIRERVLGLSHPDTSYYIRYRGALYADLGNFERCITLWMYALEMQQSVLDPLAAMTMSSFLSFAELFAFMLSESGSRLNSVQSKNQFAADILAVMEHGLEEIMRFQALVEKEAKAPGQENDRSVLNRMLMILLHLMNLMTRLPVCSSAAEHTQLLQRFKCLVYKLVRLDIRGHNGATLLHMACVEDTTHIGRYPVCSFPAYSVVHLLLQVGADPNARDSDGLAPLHVATKPGNTGFNFGIVKVLVSNGAHADMCSAEHVTPLDNLRKVGPFRRVCPVKNTTLKCLAARVIAHCRLPYKGIVGSDLESFINMH